LRPALIRRLTALVVLFVAASLPIAVAQPQHTIPRIGILGPRTAADGATYLDSFRQGLRELGWVEGKTILIETRWADGRPERLPALAAELVRLKVDVIMSGTTAVTLVCKNATQTIPIVMATGGDPVELGLVASLARPGGNITGVAYSVGSETFGKQLELLKELLPRLRRVAVLANANNPGQLTAVKHVTGTAESLDMQIQALRVREPADLDGAFAAMAKERAGALLVVADSFFGFHRKRLHDLAAKHRLPTMYGLREHAETGGLMSYSADIRDNFRLAATYVDKILKGASPAHLPVQQPTKFELVINSRTAKALGLTVPRSLLLRADHVIE
jgi:putative tryptophan/tyrosine transport system substrate-binding protein